MEEIDYVFFSQFPLVLFFYAECTLHYKNK